jgi:hypothetical protein
VAPSEVQKQGFQCIQQIQNNVHCNNPKFCSQHIDEGMNETNSDLRAMLNNFIFDKLTNKYPQTAQTVLRIGPPIKARVEIKYSH